MKASEEQSDKLSDEQYGKVQDDPNDGPIYREHLRGTETAKGGRILVKEEHKAAELSKTRAGTATPSTSDSFELHGFVNSNENHQSRGCGCDKVSKAKQILNLADNVAGVS